MVLLGWVTFARPHPQAVPARHPGVAVATDLPGLKYRSILVPLDHSDRDRAAVVHAASMARLHGATIHLLSRGLDRDTAQSLLVFAFLDDVLTGMTLGSARAAIETALIAQLPNAALLGAFR